MATGTTRVKAAEKDGWVSVAVAETLVGGRCVDGSGELLVALTASAPGSTSQGVPILAMEPFNIQLGALQTLWVRSSSFVELAVMKVA